MPNKNDMIPALGPPTYEMRFTNRGIDRFAPILMTPEMLVRRKAHSLGYRFRLHRGDLPGKPDLVFPALRKIIFVNGCFWHQHPEPSCTAARTPRSNTNYWGPKLARAAARDDDACRRLADAGWRVLTLWNVS